MNKLPHLFVMAAFGCFAGVQSAHSQGLGELGAILGNTHTKSQGAVQATVHGTSAALTQAIQLFTTGEKMVAAGNTVVGENILKQSLGYWESGANRQDPARYLKTLNTLAQISKKNGKTQDAEDYYRRGLSVAARFYGIGSDELKKAKLSLAEMCEANKRYPEATGIYKQVLELAERKTGVDDVLNVEYRDKLLKCCEKSGNYVEAETALKRLVECKRSNGTMAGNADKDLKKYVEVLRKVGKEQEAMALSGGNSSSTLSSAKPTIRSAPAVPTTATSSGSARASATPSTSLPSTPASTPSSSVPPLGSAENPILLPDDPSTTRP